MDYAEKYVEFLRNHIAIKRPLKIVCDVSNGTTGLVLEKLSNVTNLDLILINKTPDPEFDAHGPNPLLTGATDMLVKKVLETGADFGVAFDADGDRAFFVDNQGQLIPSFIIAAFWFSRSTPPFVADELVYLALTTGGIFNENQIIPSRVGSNFIKQAMQKNQTLLGAEFSGHFYFKEFFGLDSGIFALIHMANVLSQQIETTGRTLADVHAESSKQVLVNTDVALKTATWEIIQKAIREETAPIVQQAFERDGLSLITSNGWISVRPSNTEPLLRIIVGARTKDQADHDLILITDLIQKTDQQK